MLASADTQGASWRFFSSQMVRIKRLKYLFLYAPPPLLQNVHFIYLSDVQPGGKHEGQLKSFLGLRNERLHASQI